MKKFFMICSFMFAAIMLMSLNSCKEEVKTARCKVASVHYQGDTIISMKTTQGEDSLFFNLDCAEFNNGIMQVGDSVIVNYFSGSGDYNRAAYITLLPRPTQYMDEVIKEDAPVKTIDASMIHAESADSSKTSTKR